ncbi:P-loop containing nucleoside triphosphate hydrolase protein [Phyllosticta capitalensis]
MARRRYTSDVEDDDVEDSDSYDSQDHERAKRPRYTNGDASKSPGGPVMPHDSQPETIRAINWRDPDLPPLQHQPGSLVRIRLKNFVTYSSAVFNIGPALNMVIGPNGNGKSTVVCAICLGLGWSPQHLGRAKIIGEFVKHETREATIEIELAGGPPTRGRNFVIKRTIRKEDNKSTFYLDGQLTPHKRITELCKAFSIQIDNLCQFLPQDRVVEFAALSPVQLLDQTQRAAAPEHMTQRHEQLKELRRKQKVDQDVRAREGDHLTNLEGRQNAQRAEVDRMREQQQLKDKMAAYKKIRPCVKYRVIGERMREAKEKSRTAKEDLVDLRRRAEPTLEEMRDKENYLAQVSTAVKRQKSAVERLDRHANTQAQEIKRHATAIEDKEREMDAQRAQAQENKSEALRIQGAIRNLQSQMDQEPPEPFDAAQFNEQIREKTRKMREIETRTAEIDQSHRELKNRHDYLNEELQRVQKEKDNLRSQGGKQERKLGNLSRDTVRAWEWIKSNQDKFNRPVHGPPVITCSVKDPAYADAVESLFQRGDFLSITCEDKRDFRLLSEQMANMSIRDVHIKEAVKPLSSFKPNLGEEDLKSLGFTGFVLDKLAGPDAVLSMLCDTVRLHQTAVTLQKHSEEQFSRVVLSPISKWVAGRISYQVVRRREYGDAATSTTTRPVGQARVWTDQPVDEAAERECRDKIREIEHELEEIVNQRRDLKDERQANRQKTEQLNNEKKQIEEEKSERQKLQQAFTSLPVKIDTQKEKLRGYKERLDDFDSEMQRMDIEIDNLAVKKGQAAINYAKTAQILLDSHEKLYDYQVREAEAVSECEILQARNEEITAELETRQREYQALEADCRRLKNEAAGLREEIAQLVNTRSDEEADLVSEVEQTIGLDELEAEIESFNTRLTLLHGGDPNAIREFERRAKTIETLQAKLAGMDTALEELQEQIEQIKSTWEPELDELVEKISEAFSYNFQQIGCAGQVSVYKAEDFDQWSIQIQVKFREHESLSILDSHRQSGGERAVSTIFYLMALQSLARSPFRVVDEINQGMDPRNERMVHERMVQIACQEHTSQYFLITPKLLHGLDWHERMSTHIIASGEYMPDDPTSLSFAALADRRMAQKGLA